MCLTFDVDLIDHSSGNMRPDELTVAVPRLMKLWDRHPGWRATWFVRLDAQLGEVYGEADYVFRQYGALLHELRQRGHAIGWHPHCYTRRNGEWAQNTDSRGVVEELSTHASHARARGLTTVRMGWGFHTNETMALLSDLGFEADSSAIPRPIYAWELSVKDWSTSPATAFFPSRSDYRVPGEPAHAILELPVSVAPLAAPYDHGPVQRYLNPAYWPGAFQPALEWWLARHGDVVMLTHPTELMPATARRGLIAHDFGALEQNLLHIEQKARDRSARLSFVTIDEAAARLRTGAAWG
ncbi:MAG: hypothetical protein AB1806_18560 [Acidobacteriota bacterium]